MAVLRILARSWRLIVAILLPIVLLPLVLMEVEEDATCKNSSQVIRNNNKNIMKLLYRLCVGGLLETSEATFIELAIIITLRERKLLQNNYSYNV